MGKQKAFPDIRKQISYAPPYPLSATWRKRTSSDEAIELKNIQESVQRFIRIMIGPDYRVVWKGQEVLPGITNPGVTDLNNKVVYISHMPIIGQAPANPFRVDVVSGIGIHEAGHCKLTEVRGRAKVDIINNILEDSYIDYQFPREFPVPGAYINRMRDYYNGNIEDYIKRRMEQDRPLTRDELISIWGTFVLCGDHNIEVLDPLAWREARGDPDAKLASGCLSSLLRVTANAVEGKGLAESPQRYKNLTDAAHRLLDEYQRNVEPLTQAWEEKFRADHSGEGPELQKVGRIDHHSETGKTSGEGGPAPGKGDDDAKDEDEDGGAEAETGDEGGGADDNDLDKSTPAGEDPNEDEEGDNETQGSNVADASLDLSHDLDSSGSGSGGPPDIDGDGEEGDAGDPGRPNQPDAHSHRPHGDTSAPGIEQEDIPEDEPLINLEPSTCMDQLLEPMPKELAERVWDMKEHEAEDVSEIAKQPQFIMLKPGKEAMVPPVSRLSDAIRQAFETRRHLNTTLYPYQEAGRICSRTLPHILAGADDVFEEAIIEDEIDVALGLLIDCSGSIGFSGGGYNTRTGQYETSIKGQWQLIIEVCQLMAQAFDEGQLDLHVGAYQTKKYHRVYEPDYDGLRTLGVHPSGGTPSVPAMRIMVDRLKKISGARREQMIIHLTDGEPNDGGGRDAMRQLVTEVERNGVKVIGIGISVPVAALASQYRNYFSINDAQEIPAQIARILEKMKA